MDQNFCQHYKGDCYPPTNRYCRNCPEAETACNRLWQAVLDLSESNNGGPVILGISGATRITAKSSQVRRFGFSCRIIGNLI